MGRLALRYLGAKPGTPMSYYTGATVALTPGEVTEVGTTRMVVGRWPHVGLRIASAVVAREHASVQREGDAIRFVDLNSTNGSRVNGARVKTVLLRPGDRVMLSEGFEFEVVELA